MTLIIRENREQQGPRAALFCLPHHQANLPQPSPTPNPSQPLVTTHPEPGSPAVSLRHLPTSNMAARASLGRWDAGRSQQVSRESCFPAYIRRRQRVFRSFGFRLGGGKGATLFGRPESGFIRHQPPPPCRPSSTPTRSKSVRALDVAGAARWSIPPPRSPSGLGPSRRSLSHAGPLSCCPLEAFPGLRSGRCEVLAESLDSFWVSASPRVNREGGPDDLWWLCSTHAIG